MAQALRCGISGAVYSDRGNEAVRKLQPIAAAQFADDGDLDTGAFAGAFPSIGPIFVQTASLNWFTPATFTPARFFLSELVAQCQQQTA